MKRITAWTLSLCILFSMTACGRQVGETTATSDISQSGVSQSVLKESQPSAATEENTQPAQAAGQEHILIAYFSWADNTVVEDEEASVQSALSHYESIGDSANYNGIDAVTSSSVVVPGNTAQMAQWIQEYVGGELFPIIVKETYPDNYDECMERAADEKAENARPELANHLDNIGDYDVIFLGFPNWWSSAPMAIFSFIEEYDLSGKTIVPFCAHGTGGIAAGVRDITAALPDSVTVLDALGVYRADIGNAGSTVHEWLAELGFEKKEEASQMENEERKLKMTVDGQEISITLYDTPAANALYEMLPLELAFEDFNGIERFIQAQEKYPTDFDELRDLNHKEMAEGLAVNVEGVYESESMVMGWLNSIDLQHTGQLKVLSANKPSNIFCFVGNLLARYYFHYDQIALPGHKTE